MHKRGLPVRLFLLALLLMPDAARGEVAPTTLEKMTGRADAIAVARVDRIISVNGVRVALAAVFLPLKELPVGQRFAFIAQPTWACDDSTARQGEIVLLFLTRRRGMLGGLPVFSIAHAGSGRVPVERHGGRSVLWAWLRRSSAEPQRLSLSYEMIRLPAGFPSLPEPVDKNGVPSGRVPILLSDAQKAIRSLVTARAAGSSGGPGALTPHPLM